ncbi:type I secretion system permease/ATPase [Ideonella sp. YS5]|uniref:type I secretion system permease/ATPase n=1 Tax=Ideonella sp. YS5 TaxID=3453714 RepID=UPI003EEC7999
MNAFVRRHARLFVAAGVFSLVLNLALLMPSLYMLQVYDRVLPTRSGETLVMLSLVAATALLLGVVMDAVRGRLLVLAGSLFDRDVGLRGVRRLLEGGTAVAADDAPAAMRDVAIVRNFFAGPGLAALFDAPWMPIYVAAIFAFDSTLGLLALACAAVLVLLAWANERGTRAGTERAQLQAREAARFADGALRHGEVVKAMGMAPAVGAQWLELSDRARRQQLRTQAVGGLLTSATKGFRQSVQVAMLAAAAWLVIGQKATPGVMIAVTVILGRALAPVEMLVGQWKAIAESRAAWRRLDSLLGRPGAALPTPLPRPTGALALEGVVYLPSGASRPTIRQLSLEVAAGEVLAVVGPSGCGKSTLARLMLGLLAPQAGSVRLDGAALSQWGGDELGPHVGYVPQEVALLEGTVADNICRLGAADRAGVVEAATRAHAHEMILRLPQGYDTPVGEGGRRLSGGQRQRVALARALCGDPRLVVLDEPNAHLDSEGEAALAQAIADLRQRRVTVVLVTQRSQVLSAVDRIAVLRDGAIERIGARQDKSAGHGEATVGVLQQA